MASSSLSDYFGEFVNEVEMDSERAKATLHQKATDTRKHTIELTHEVEQELEMMETKLEELTEDLVGFF